MANVNKIAKSIRLTPHGTRLLEALAKELGLSLTSVVETAVREKAKREGIQIPTEEEREEATV